MRASPGARRPLPRRTLRRRQRAPHRRCAEPRRAGRAMPSRSVCRTIAAVLVLATSSLAQMTLAVAAVPGRVEMRVDGAVPGTAVVALVAPQEDPSDALGLPRVQTVV